MGKNRESHEALPERARWDDLEAFQEIYKGIQKNRTIEEVGQSHAHSYGGPRTLYRRLDRLEKALEAQLIFRERWSRETRITPAGEKLYQQLEQIISLKKNLEKEFQSKRPLIRIATSESIAFHIIAKVLATTPNKEQFPVELHFREGNDWHDAIEIVRRGEADIAMLNVPTTAMPLADLRSKILSEPLAWPLIVHPKHRFAHRQHNRKLQPVRFEELRQEDMTIHQMYQNDFLPGRVSRSLFVVPRLASGLALVQQGAAVAPWCEALARLAPAEGVVKVPLDSKLCCVSVMVFAHHFPLYPPEPIKSFLKRSQQIFQEAIESAHQHL